MNIKNLAKKIKWDMVIYVFLVAGVLAYLHLVEPPEEDFLGFEHLFGGLAFIIIISASEFLLNLRLLIGKDRKSIARWVFLFVMITFSCVCFS